MDNNTKEKGLVSVVIPAYNAAWCIEKAIDSVLLQTYPSIEIIIINDGSTDETEQRLCRYSNDIRVHKQPNKGLSSARNFGIQVSKGEFIAFLDADDYWLPQKIQKQASLLKKNPEIGFCSTAARVEDLNGEFLNDWTCPEIKHSVTHTIFQQNAAIAGSGSSVMVRRKLLDQESFDETLKSLEDIDMWMRLSVRMNYFCICEPLTVIVKRDQSMSRNLKIMKKSTFFVLKKNRYLLEKKYRGTFWQSAYAGALTDFAKWEYRNGNLFQAVVLLLEGLLRSPLGKGRLIIGLLLAMLKREVI